MVFYRLKRPPLKKKDSWGAVKFLLFPECTVTTKTHHLTPHVLQPFLITHTKCLCTWTYAHWKTQTWCLRMYNMSSYREETLSFLNYRAPVTFMTYFAFQSHGAEFHSRCIIFLLRLTGWLITYTDTQDTEGNGDLFSVPSNPGERPLSVLAWQCIGATTELLSTALCVSACVCVHACEAKQRRVAL